MLYLGKFSLHWNRRVSAQVHPLCMETVTLYKGESSKQGRKSGAHSGSLTELKRDSSWKSLQHAAYHQNGVQALTFLSLLFHKSSPCASLIPTFVWTKLLLTCTSFLPVKLLPSLGPASNAWTSSCEYECYLLLAAPSHFLHPPWEETKVC